MSKKITKKVISRMITTQLIEDIENVNIDVTSEENQKIIRKISKQKMYNFWVSLNYFKDENESLYEELINKLK